MSISVLQIEERKPQKKFALFEMGFRPFFLLASLYAVISTGLWMAAYAGGFSLAPQSLPATYWHAHEMIFGYGLAVVSGFLLTVVHNWTNLPPLKGWRLGVLASLWLAGRILFLMQAPWQLTMTVEMAFAAGLFTATFIPLYRAKQSRNLYIFASKVALFGIANLLFYLGMAGIFTEGLRWGLYTGLYLLVALIFTMGRRVIPFFIEKGIGYPLQVKNSKVADLTSLFGLLGLWMSELFAPVSAWTIGFALLTAGAQIVRLYWWYAKGLWSKPLIWVLWSALAWVTIGLLFKAWTEWHGQMALAAWHSIAYGGIGMVTIGMMSRASLGHTGRSVFEPPRLLGPIFLLLMVGAVIRSFFPVLLPEYHYAAVVVSMSIWMLVFSAFFMLFAYKWVGPSKRR